MNHTCLGLGIKYYPLNMGIVISQYKGPYEPTRMTFDGSCHCFPQDLLLLLSRWTMQAVIWGAHPRNNLRRNSSFVSVWRLQENWTFGVDGELRVKETYIPEN